jgi:uncharacterized protein (DUF4415 family)
MNKEHGPSGTEKVAEDKARWERLRALADADVRFTEDAPATSPEDWADAVPHRGLPVPPRKAQIALRVDEDVLAWFKAQGAGYQARMNAVLRAFRDAELRAAKGGQ